MNKTWKLSLLITLLLLINVACSKNGTPEPLPTIVVDEACQSIISHSFLSTVSYQLGESEQGPIFGPHMVSFLNDGRAIWKYSTESYIGTFTCENAQFKATFTEGEKKSFEGTYSAETNMIRIDDVNYLMATDE